MEYTVDGGQELTEKSERGSSHTPVMFVGLHIQQIVKERLMEVDLLGIQRRPAWPRPDEQPC
jgi:hypothetical protein